MGTVGPDWLNAHPGWKPLVRTGLIVPISLSKLIVASKLSHKIAALLLVFGCIGLAVSAGKHEKWSKSKTAVTGIMLAFLAVVVYGIVMTPKPALADRTVYNLDSQEVYFLYEDHIGKPVLMSEYEDIDDDGYFVMETFVGTEEYHLPIWQATYTPFGSVYEDFDSTGITVGKEPDTQVSWTVPFRFPGQYADPELNGGIYYNWHRYYAPEIGRYNRADPTGNIEDNLYAYALNNPISYIDFSGLKCCKFKETGVWYDVEPGDLLVWDRHVAMVYDCDSAKNIRVAENLPPGPKWNIFAQTNPRGLIGAYRHPRFKKPNVKYFMAHSGVTGYCPNQWNRLSSCQDCAGYVSRVWSKLGVSVSSYVFYLGWAEMANIAISNGGYKLESHDEEKECCPEKK